MKCTQIGQEGRLAWKYTYIYMFVLVCSKLLMFDMEFSLDYLLDILSCGLELEIVRDIQRYSEIVRDSQR